MQIVKDLYDGVSKYIDGLDDDISMPLSIYHFMHDPRFSHPCLYIKHKESPFIPSTLPMMYFRFFRALDRSIKNRELEYQATSRNEVYWYYTNKTDGFYTLYIKQMKGGVRRHRCTIVGPEYEIKIYSNDRMIHVEHRGENNILVEKLDNIIA